MHPMGPARQGVGPLGDLGMRSVFAKAQVQEFERKVIWVTKKKGKKKKIVKPDFGQILYDENGYRVGDDGYPMTRCRRRLHRTLDLLLMGGYVCIVVAIVCVLAAFFQNQSITPMEFVYYGGNEFNGVPIANLLRIEALCVFLIGLAVVALSHRGFSWLYDDEEDRRSFTKFYAMVVVLFGGWNAYLLLFVGLIDPLSLTMAVLVGLMVRFVAQVDEERETLRPSVVSGKASPAGRGNV